jgi:GIY-YIG catalytic domain
VDTKDKTVKTGIYAIICLLRGFWYVGKSFELAKRINHEFWELRNNRHPCKPLQDDWNRFGPDQFKTTLLESVADESQLCARERAWTKKLLVEEKVYNQQNAITERHRREFQKCKPKWPDEPIGSAARQYHFVTPLGGSMKVRGLKGICQAYGLNMSHMSKVARGVYVQHRGWTSRKTEDEIFKT